MQGVKRITSFGILALLRGLHRFDEALFNGNWNDRVFLQTRICPFY